MKRSIIFIIVLCFILSSCAKNASPVEKKSKSENVSLLYDDLEYVTPNHLEDYCSKIYEENYDHLTVRESVRILSSNITELNHLYLKYRDSFLFDKEEALISYLNKEAYSTDEMTVEYDEFEEIPSLEYHTLNYDGGFPYYTLYDGGSMVWTYDSISEDFYNANNDENITDVVFCCNDNYEKKYKLKDCEMSISEAEQIGNDFINKLDEFGYPKLCLHDIKVKKLNEYYAFEIDVSAEYQDIPIRGSIDGRGAIASSYKDMFHGKLSERNCNPYGYIIMICSSEGVTFFGNNEQVFDVADKTEIKSIITPDSALRFINANLGDQSNYEVEYMGLQYKTYYVDIETNVYESQPFWCVSLYSPTEDKYYYALVDCETGDFSFYAQ